MIFQPAYNGHRDCKDLTAMKVQLIVIGGDGIMAEQSLAIKLILVGYKIKKEVNQHCPFVGDGRLLALPL